MYADAARAVIAVTKLAAAVLIVLVAQVASRPATAGSVRLVGNVQTLDPVHAADVYTQAVAGTLFDQLYMFDYLARPLQLRPLAAADLPKTSPDGRELTIGIRHGIRFSPHPSFGGRPRELTAEDVVYSIKRFMDPALRSPIMALVAGKIEGLDELASRTARKHERFDYDEPVDGLIALDRHTLRIRLTHADPTFVYFLANPDLSIVPREAVEADGDDFARRPTGSGPYRVREFSPGTRLVLERNPDYRPMHWEDVATSGRTDPPWAGAFHGRRFPLPDRVELIDIPEPTTQLLALERGDVDVITAPVAAIRNEALDPRLAAAGFTLVRAPASRLSWISFNLRDPVVGGTAPANIALRRAIAMSIDDDEYDRVFDRGMSSAPTVWIPMDIAGHDSAYRNPIRYEPATANALLDRFGYVKGADGFRRGRDGGPLTIAVTVGTSSREREWSESVKRGFDRIGLRVRFDAVEFSEAVSRQVSCRFQLHGYGGWVFDWPDGSNLMLAFYGKSIGSVGEACMEDPEFDRVYEQLVAAPLGPPRAPLYRRLIDRLNALTPVRLMPVRDEMYLVAPGVQGLVIHPAPGPNFAQYPYLDIAPGHRGRR